MQYDSSANAKTGQPISTKSILAHTVNLLNSLGYNVVPSKIGSKHPCVKWKVLQKRRVKKCDWNYWRRYKASGNFMLLTGVKDYNPQPGLICVDGDDEAAVKLIKDRCPMTRLGTKRDDRQHFYFRRPNTPERIKNRQKTTIDGVTYNLDIRGDGGAVVLPGSTHKTGGLYLPLEPWTESLIANAPIYDPAWLPDEKESDHEYEPQEFVGSDLDESERLKQCRAWLEDQPGAQQSKGAKGADGYCYKLAIDVVWGFLLSEEAAIEALYEWGQRDDQLDALGSPWTWDRAQIGHKVDSAVKAHYSGKPGDKVDRSAFVDDEALALSWGDVAGNDPMIDGGPAEPKPEPPKPTGQLWRWSEFKKIALAQQDQWIIRDIMEEGTLTILSGLPYAGKTTLLAQMIACIAFKQPFFGYEVCQRCPIVFVNCDRLRERIIYSRIARTLTDDLDEAALEETLLFHNTETIPTTITADYIKYLADESYKVLSTLAVKTATVILDPLRSAVLREQEGGAENDPTTMNNVLAPIRAVAKETNTHILMPHHNNRGKDQYAGAASILGNCGGYWNLSRDYTSKVSTLNIMTRDGIQPALQIEETATGLKRLEHATAKAMEADDAGLDAFIEAFPMIAHDGLTYAEIVTKGFATSVTEAKDKCQLATVAGRHPRLNSSGKGVKGDPLKWFKA